MRENRTSGSEGGEPGNRHSPTPIGRSERLLAAHGRGRARTPMLRTIFAAARRARARAPMLRTSPGDDS